MILRAICFFGINHDVPALSPFSDPKLNAKPCERLRIRTNPVIGPFSPSFSMLKFASASSPVMPSAFVSSQGALSTQLTKNTLGVQIGAQELTVPFQSCLWRQTTHVRALHQLIEELSQSAGILLVDVDFVLPLKLCPHRPERSL